MNSTTETCRTYTVPSYDGVSLQILDRGNPDSPLVYLVHGMLTNHHFFDDLADFLAMNYRVITYDHRGHGRSGIQGKSCSLHQLAHDFSHLIHTIQGDKPKRKAYILGHSMGGMVIGAWARAYPTDVEQYAAGIALCNTAFSDVISHNQILGFHLPNWKILKDFSGIVAMFPVKNNFLGRFFIHHLNYQGRVDGQRMLKYILSAQSVAPAVTRQLLVDVNHMDLRDAIKNITVPTTVITSSHDKLLDPILGKNIADKLAHYGYLQRYELIKNCGHASPHERPDVFQSIIAQSLSEIF